MHGRRAVPWRNAERHDCVTCSRGDPDVSGDTSRLRRTAVRTLIERCLATRRRLRLRDIGEATDRPVRPLFDTARGDLRHRRLRAVPGGSRSRRVARRGRSSRSRSSSLPRDHLWFERLRTADRPILTAWHRRRWTTLRSRASAPDWSQLGGTGRRAVARRQGACLHRARGHPAGDGNYSFAGSTAQASPVGGTERVPTHRCLLAGRKLGGILANGRLLKVALSGGTVTPICPVEEARGGAWSDGWHDCLCAPSRRSALPRCRPRWRTVASDDARGGVGGRTPPVAAVPARRQDVAVHGPWQYGAAHQGHVIVQNASGRTLVQRRGDFPGRYSPSGHLST